MPIFNKDNNLISGAYQNLIREKLSPHVCQIFGYHALLYQPLAQELVQPELTIKHQVVIDSHLNSVNVVCSFNELPIASDTIDLAVLPNILQASKQPHQILREVERVLIPEGTAIIIGRNPYSWRGFLARNKQWRQHPKSVERDIGRRRICDWFNLLGFEAEQLINVSLSNQQIQNKPFYPWVKKLSQFSCDLFGSYYIIIAKKKVSNLTPIRPSWRRNKQLVPPRLAEPSVRSHVESMFRRLNKKSD